MVNSNKGKRWVMGEDGVMREGKAAAKPGGDLSQLPAHWVTKDISEDNKIHELDPPNVKRELMAELSAKDLGQEKAEAAVDSKKLGNLLPPPSETVPVNQTLIDIIRLRIIAVLITNATKAADQGREIDLSVQHVWFPDNNINNRELRAGNPPSDSGRPKWLRGLRLEIDVFNWPESIKDRLRELNVSIPKLDDLETLYAKSKYNKEWLENLEKHDTGELIQ